MTKKNKKYLLNNNINKFHEIKNIDDLQKISHEILWQDFEKLVAFIFEENDFEVYTNKIKTNRRKRRQYDVISRKGDITFIVECKKWAGNRYRLSAIKRAVEQHRERTTFYKVLTGENAIPILVTLIEEEIKLYEDIPIVPIFRLNSFIDEARKIFEQSDHYTEWNRIKLPLSFY